MGLYSYGNFQNKARVINAKYRFSCKLIEEWGYTLVDEITWVKKTINGKIAKGHGFYLQHAKV
jgi:mRNA (2'-O-methyladenosine-N6-)-methyltransferase